MVEDDEAAARLAHAAHLPRHRDRIRHDADEIRRVNDVEAVVRERHVRRIHLLEADIPQSFRQTRSWAFSSIELDRSMPTTEQSTGYRLALMPVPTPTSSTRSPGRIFIRRMASTRPG